MQELRGKVAVVTGGASGIGLAMARRFSAEGMKVVVADIEAPALAEAAGRLRSGGADVLDVVTDVSQAGQVEELAAKTVAHYGAVHVVCNNAGVAGGGGPVWDIPLGEWEWVLGVNLWGVVHGVRSFLPRLLEAGEGHVVNTASMAGLLGLYTSPPYAVSKFGVVALSESLHNQLQIAGAPVGVSVLCPAWVRTRIHESGRNRPPGAGAPVATGLDEPVRQAMERIIESGLGPAVVAEKVLAAVRSGQFYVLPHDDEFWLGLIRERTDNIVEGRNPTPAPLPGSDLIKAAITGLA
ncbi:MAG TPA: SDR family NAD(P)-dependent oxidoreductase [Acidimicrobiales bacterium]|nr:SDR family NAD(P)-dependent oxidoreductase [Acidimicrobiales bacterium]